MVRDPKRLQAAMHRVLAPEPVRAGEAPGDAEHDRLEVRRVLHDLVDGLEARGTRTLLITGHPDAMQVMESRGLPYLAKPFRIRELIGALERVLPSRPVPASD